MLFGCRGGQRTPARSRVTHADDRRLGASDSPHPYLLALSPGAGSPCHERDRLPGARKDRMTARGFPGRYAMTRPERARKKSQPLEAESSVPGRSAGM